MNGVNRREFISSAVLGGTVLASGLTSKLPESKQAKTKVVANPPIEKPETGIKSLDMRDMRNWPPYPFRFE